MGGPWAWGLLIALASTLSAGSEPAAAPPSLLATPVSAELAPPPLLSNSTGVLPKGFQGPHRPSSVGQRLTAALVVSCVAVIFLVSACWRHLSSAHGRLKGGLQERLLAAGGLPPQDCGPGPSSGPSDETIFEHARKQLELLRLSEMDASCLSRREVENVRHAERILRARMNTLTRGKEELAYLRQRVESTPRGPLRDILVTRMQRLEWDIPNQRTALGRMGYHPRQRQSELLALTDYFRQGRRICFPAAAAMVASQVVHNPGTPLPDVLNVRQRVEANLFIDCLVSEGRGHLRIARSLVPPTTEQVAAMERYIARGNQIVPLLQAAGMRAAASSVQSLQLHIKRELEATAAARRHAGHHQPSSSLRRQPAPPRPSMPRPTQLPPPATRHRRALSLPVPRVTPLQQPVSPRAPSVTPPIPPLPVPTQPAPQEPRPQQEGLWSAFKRRLRISGKTSKVKTTPSGLSPLQFAAYELRDWARDAHSALEKPHSTDDHESGLEGLFFLGLQRLDAARAAEADPKPDEETQRELSEAKLLCKKELEALRTALFSRWHSQIATAVQTLEQWRGEVVQAAQQQPPRSRPSPGGALMQALIKLRDATNAARNVSSRIRRSASVPSPVESLLEAAEQLSALVEQSHEMILETARDIASGWFQVMLETMQPMGPPPHDQRSPHSHPHPIPQPGPLVRDAELILQLLKNLGSSEEDLLMLQAVVAQASQQAQGVCSSVHGGGAAAVRDEGGGLLLQAGEGDAWPHCKGPNAQDDGLRERRRPSAQRVQLGGNSRKAAAALQ
ncbi:hypothetical protein Efla_006165 [Eimeria flavescens]